MAPKDFPFRFSILNYFSFYCGKMEAAGGGEFRSGTE